MPGTEGKPTEAAAPDANSVPERVPWPHTNLSEGDQRLAESLKRGGPGDAQQFDAEGNLIRHEPRQWWKDEAFLRRLEE
jgi:hypothetical protein